MLPTIRRAYATTTCALRLPLHGGFEPMAAVTRDIPFIARQSSRDPAETRDALGVGTGLPLVLASFGAYGADLPVERLLQSDRFTLVDPRREPPPGFVYQDLVAAADVVVSKPGYGIVSECVANQTALLYTSRGRFVEYDALRRPDAALLAVPLHFAGRSAGGPMGRRRGGAAGTGGAAGEPASRRRRGRSRLPAAHPLRLSAERRRRRSHSL